MERAPIKVDSCRHRQDTEHGGSRRQEYRAKTDPSGLEESIFERESTLIMFMLHEIEQHDAVAYNNACKRDDTNTRHYPHLLVYV